MASHTLNDTRKSKREWDARRSHKSANIAPVPTCVNVERRESCKNSLRLFLETYFPRAFYRGWSDDHLEVIGKTQQAVIEGGFFAVAMPRGSGKTTIHQRAAIWAIIYGHARYVFIVCADAEKAKKALRSIKTEFEFNQLLFADFPEVCYPIRKLEGTAQASKKQHVDGIPTLIDWTVGSAQLPHVEGSIASGSLIGVGGITGAARGAQVTLPSGEVLRPTLLLVDDFQTRESAASTTQSKTRLDTLAGDLAGMRGPGEPLAILATMTVIYRGDAADRLLNRSDYPDWHGTRKKLVYEWPQQESLWEEYGELRRSAFQRDESPTAANEFYLQNREAMDLGAVVAWPDRYNDDELSAIQHAYNLRLIDEEAFQAEYQNEPVTNDSDEFDFLTVDAIAEKLSDFGENQLPPEVQYITAGVDVQGNSLWWVVCAWAADFTGWVADYGVWPEQGRRTFTQRNLHVSFANRWPGRSEEECIFSALKELVGKLSERRWIVGGSDRMGLARILVDEGYKQSVIHSFCGHRPYDSLCTPAKGFGIHAGKQPMTEWAVKKNERCGHHWRLRSASGDKRIRYVGWDANYWKTFLHERLTILEGGCGSLSICGSSPIEHRLYAQHLAASETPAKTEGHGRKLIEWTSRPTRPDNHWLDASAMAAVAGSLMGAALPNTAAPKPPKKQRMTLSEMAKQHG